MADNKEADNTDMIKKLQQKSHPKPSVMTAWEEEV